MHKYPFLLLSGAASASASPDLRLGAHVNGWTKCPRAGGLNVSKGAGLFGGRGDKRNKMVWKRRYGGGI